MSDDALFGRGDFEESRTVTGSPEIEHAVLPQAAKKERILSLTLSCETVEQREALVDLLAQVSVVDVLGADEADARAQLTAATATEVDMKIASARLERAVAARAAGPTAAQLSEAKRMVKRGNGSWACEWPLEDHVESLF